MDATEYNTKAIYNIWKLSDLPDAFAGKEILENAFDQFSAEVIKFQETRALHTDGKLGPQTLAEMQQKVNAPGLDSVSIRKLQTCHPQLIELVNAVHKVFSIRVLDGHRNKERQMEAWRRGTGVMWPKSKHNQFPSMAVDIAFVPIDWNDIDKWKDFGKNVLAIAENLGINVRWGGHFTNLFDGPHFELIEEDN